MIRKAAILVALLTAVTASAQRPLFDPEDFVDPRATGGRPVFISRLVIGAASNMNGDGFRALGENVGYVHLANSFSWRSVQFDYKRSQLKAEDGEAALWEVERQPDLLISPPPQQELEHQRQTRTATPRSKDTLNAALYWPVPVGAGIPVMLRSRITFTTQPIDTEISDGQETERISGNERTFAFDTDTWFRVAGRNVFGSLAVSETKTTGTLADRKERAVSYTSRFPSLALDRAKILIRPTLTVGGISNRGGSAVNLVNPAIEIFRPFLSTGANLHVIYSPQWINETSPLSEIENARWGTKHQVAVYLDYPIFAKVF